MTTKNEACNLLLINAIEGIDVKIIPSSEHEFLMETRQVAYGYGISASCLRSHISNHTSEFTLGKHFVCGVQTLDSVHKTPHNKMFFTKRGIVRLGFFIKSERAKLFRDWAEDLILKVNEQRDLFGTAINSRQLPPRRNHNRLTQDRMVSILADVCRIDDKELRMSITNKLMGGNNI